MLTYIYLICMIKSAFHRLRSQNCLGREYLFQFFAPCLQSFLYGNDLTAVYKCRFLCYRANHCTVIFGVRHFFQSGRNDFHNNITHGIFKELLCCQGFFQLYAQFITECHLGNGCCHACCFQRIGGYHCLFLHQLMDKAVQLCHCIIFGNIKFILLNLKANQLISCLL